MTFSIPLDQFLTQNRIPLETWDAAKITWGELVEIADNYLSRRVELSEAASFFAQLIQKVHAVHSVRWRVKDVDHLLEKIVRKRAEANKKNEEGNKYLNINSENYGEIVTDLIGLRALHLFKDECFEIDSSLRATFEFLDGEDPKAYVRDGDPVDFKNRLEEAGLKWVPHTAGYRSIHYIVVSRPLRKLISAEIQVRTIFEEGWSEIDHRVRYPNFSDDPLIGWYLNIFNGLAGHADELGSFVQSLVSLQEKTKQQIAEKNLIYEDTLKKLDATVAELEQVRQSNQSSDDVVRKLREELSVLRSTSRVTSSARDFLLGTPSIQALMVDSVRNIDPLLIQTALLHKSAIGQGIPNPK
ncbi:RelA/SpoT domain-containing protein [Comamonas thiooxydans]|uniref:RelA/SpoT domain-containing protein n=2 Tax=Comamonas thiooxydans TaxID=363952 RepID=UPI0001BB17A9|nr:hypothetical protein [Comamonas thiooxydans]ACY33182.1 hypothetical protein CtCNB1_2436 [Comamonas thiooxydans]MDO1476952.1 hypothetical protein [Comamonas thiooxydans]